MSISRSAIRTPLTLDDARAAIAQACVSLNLPSALNHETISLLTAQSALETGRWKSLWCYNLGNIKSGPDKPHYYMRCNEVIGGRVVWFDPPHPQTRFRAYDSAAHGAAQFVGFIALDTTGNGRNRYARAWDAALLGDCDRFVHELARAGYFTASVDRYLRAVRSIYQGILKLDPIAVTADRSQVSDADLDLLPLDPDWPAMQAERDRIIIGGHK